jgi:hypothetical protein
VCLSSWPQQRLARHSSSDTNTTTDVAEATAATAATRASALATEQRLQGCWTAKGLTLALGCIKADVQKELNGKGYR